MFDTVFTSSSKWIIRTVMRDSAMIVNHFLSTRNRDHECGDRAAIGTIGIERIALHVNTPAVGLDDLLGDGQSQSRPRPAVLRLSRRSADERLEDGLPVFRPDVHAHVGH